MGREGWEGGGGISFEVIRIRGEGVGVGVEVDMMKMCGVGCEREKSVREHYSEMSGDTVWLFFETNYAPE